MVVLPGVLRCRPLRRTVQVRLGTNTLWLPGGTPIFVVSRQQFMKYPVGENYCLGDFQGSSMKIGTGYAYLLRDELRISPNIS